MYLLNYHFIDYKKYNEFFDENNTSESIEKEYLE